MKLQIGAVFYAHLESNWCLWLCRSENQAVVIGSNHKSNIGVVYNKRGHPFIETWEWEQNKLLSILYAENT